MRIAFQFFLIISFLSISLSSRGQENYNWSIQFGSRSTLLGGTIIGGVDDLSATFYNPGNIILNDTSKLILSAQVYQFDQFKIFDGAGEGLDLKNSFLTPAPAFVAFNLKFKFLKKDKIVISALTRKQSRYDFYQAMTDSLDVIPESSSKEVFSGGARYEKRFSDLWGGISYSTALTTKIGIGLTWYFSFNWNKVNTQTILASQFDATNVVSSTTIDNFNYINGRTLLKLGIGFDLNKLKIGMNVTSPSLNLFGDGDIGLYRFLSGVDSSIYVSNYQTGVKSEYKNPLSIGMGFSYTANKLVINVSAEWFDKVEEYKVLDTQPFQSQSGNVTIDYDLTFEEKSIINYGLGLEYKLKESLAFSASFITDFSTRDPNTNTNLTLISNYDVYRFALGSTMKIKKTELTLGLAFAYGADFFNNKVNISPDPDDPQGSVRSTEIEYNQVKILLGFVF